MLSQLRFAVLVVVSFVVIVGILRFVLRRRDATPGWIRVGVVAVIVVLGGMVFARTGAQLGLPWWIYYTVPMLVTVLLPPLAFRMNMRESASYLVLAFLSAPTIHVLFSLLLGWNEYMPFVPIPSLRELVSG